VEHFAAIAGKARGLVGHKALTLRGADRRAEVRALRQAGLALAAFRRVERNDVIARLDRGHARAYFAHDARAFMAKNGGEFALGIEARQRVGIGMANAGRHDFDQHFAGPWTTDFDCFDSERLLRFPGDGCA